MPTRDDSPLDLMALLFERAKELVCLYQVLDSTADPDRTPDEVCRDLVDAIPPGWMHPDACWARITFDSSVYEPAERTETPWVLRAPLVVMGKPAGAIEVFYEQHFAKADEGPFLKEERRLLDHIAMRLGQFLTERRLRSMARNWKDAIEQAPADERRDWRVIIEFLRRTDPHLLTRVSRRMINYLVWSGIDEAENLLEHLSANQRSREASDENRPIERASVDELMRVTNAAFRVAASNLTEEEIVHVIEQWVKDDKSGFLVEAVENQRTSLTEIADALERFEQMGFGDKELSRSVQLGLRVSLVRRFLTDDLEYINTAKNYLHVHDFCDIVQRVVSPAGSRGKLGGKSSGLLLAYHIVRRSEEYADAIGALQDAEDVVHHVGRPPGVPRSQPPAGHPQPEIPRGRAGPEGIPAHRPGVQELGVAEGGLEGTRGGPRRHRRQAAHRPQLQPARRPDRLGLLGEVQEPLPGEPREQARPAGRRLRRDGGGVREHVQPRPHRVPRRARTARPPRRDGDHDPGSGRHAGGPLLPAGVRRRGVQQQRVPLVAPDQPRRRPGAPRTRPRHARRRPAQRRLPRPVLAGPAGAARQGHARRSRCGTRRCASTSSTSTRTGSPRCSSPTCSSSTGRSTRCSSRCSRQSTGTACIRWAGSTGTAPPTTSWPPSRAWPPTRPFLAQMRSLLRVLREKIGGPVDLEFAHDGTDLYLLQCRPQSAQDDASPVAIPKDVPNDRVIFAARRFVSNGRVPDLTHIVFVDPEGYAALGSEEALRDVGRAVGRLNKLLPKRCLRADGPGPLGQPRRHQARRAGHLLGHQQHVAAHRDRLAQRRVHAGTLLRHAFLPGPGRVVDPLPAAVPRRRRGPAEPGVPHGLREPVRGAASRSTRTSPARSVSSTSPPSPEARC